jgi:hypothetical protein
MIPIILHRVAVVLAGVERVVVGVADPVLLLGITLMLLVALTLPVVEVGVVVEGQMANGVASHTTHLIHISAWVMSMIPITANRLVLVG